jgi:SlyX protein
MNVEKMMPDEERLIVMETKLATQEDLVDVLNQTVYRQQKKIDELESLCIALAKRMAGLQTNDAGDMPANERPPHY